MQIYSLDPDRDFQKLIAFMDAVSREPPTAETLRATLTAEAQLRRLTAIAGERGDLIGYCSVTRLASAPAGQATLWVATHPRHRRQGVATALYQDACAFLRAQQLADVRSRVEDDDRASLAFAQRRGFGVDRHFFRSMLDLRRFDAAPFQPVIDHAQARGIAFTTLAALGDTPATRRVYELNKLTAADIPGRGPFFSFEEYEQRRFSHPAYRAEGVILALAGAQWVGLTQVSLHPEERFAFNEMTGVTREYRGRQIAQALKLLAISYAQAQHMPELRTFNDSANTPILAINRKLGYRPEPGFYFVMAELM
ncbi:MAG TPA: GNAT family N-acetyltransferase [Roseiflexaceae bacterium]|nr:GNAT family N-acetyltransferase [Roseiflexaceae bacterium]